MVRFATGTHRHLQEVRCEDESSGHFVRAFVWTCAPPGTELEPDLYYFSIQLLQLLSRNHMESLIPYPIDHLSTSLTHPGGNSCARELAFGGARASGSQNAR